MDRWASFVRPFAPGDPCQHCGRRSCDTTQPEAGRLGDLNNEVESNGQNRASVSISDQHHDLDDAMTVPRNSVDTCSLSDRKESGEEELLCSAHPRLGKKGWPRSYVAAPGDDDEGGTNKARLLRGAAPRRHWSQRHHVLRSRSVADRWSADCVPPCSGRFRAARCAGSACRGPTISKNWTRRRAGWCAASGRATRSSAHWRRCAPRG